MASKTKSVRKAVFPVAGLGTRFLPATKAVPKEMLTVVDRPVIQHVVDEAKAAGIEHFIFVTGRNKSPIEDHFDSQYELERTLLRCAVRWGDLRLRSKDRLSVGQRRLRVGAQRVGADIALRTHQAA
jgi:UTP--glucose-1-phosphate uridylyltransferase